jgi:carboxymethylenebutenolidase
MNQPEGYLAIPSSGGGRGVLVLHAWWGLNDFFKSLCDRFAEHGFVAFAPDMFSGEIARTVLEAEQHLSQFNETRDVPPIVSAAVEYLSKHPAVTNPELGVVGFSMGAYWALWLAQENPNLLRAVVLFYGTNGGGGDFLHSNASYMGHFAEFDPYESAEAVDGLEKAIKSSGKLVTFYRYEGVGHWFFEHDRHDAHNPEAANLAWERTIDFLKRASDG